MLWVIRINPVITHIVSLLCLVSGQQNNNDSSVNEPVRTVNITRKEKEYHGMLEYKQGDESRLIKTLVVGMLTLFVVEQ